jgi:CRISPR-associated protein Csx16
MSDNLWMIGYPEICNYTPEQYLKNVVIVSRHAGAIQWLSNLGIVAKVIPHVENEDDIAFKVVIGNLPFNLAWLPNNLYVIEMPLLRADQRGKDLSPEEMDNAGAVLQQYRVEKV